MKSKVILIAIAALFATVAAAVASTGAGKRTLVLTLRAIRSLLAD